MGLFYDSESERQLHCDSQVITNREYHAMHRRPPPRSSHSGSERGDGQSSSRSQSRHVRVRFLRPAAEAAPESIGGRPAPRPPVCERRFKAGEWRAIRCHRADSMIAASSVGLRRSCLAADPLALPLVRHFQQPQPLCCALLVGEDVVVVLFPTAYRLNTHT